MCDPTPYGQSDRMSPSLQIMAGEQHLAELHRTSDERRRKGRLARKAERARRAQAGGARRGLRSLRPAV